MPKQATSNNFLNIKNIENWNNNHNDNDENENLKTTTRIKYSNLYENESGIHFKTRANQKVKNRTKMIRRRVIRFIFNDRTRDSPR